MTICRGARAFFALAVDAVEGILYAVCDFDRVADEIWAEAGANRLADKEAEEEVYEPRDFLASVRCSCGVEITVPKQSFAHRVVGQCPECGAPFDVRLHASSSSPVSASAGDDHSGGSVPHPGVEPPESLILLTAKDFDDAAYAIWRYAETRDGVIRKSWYELSDKFKTTAENEINRPRR